MEPEHLGRTHEQEDRMAQATLKQVANTDVRELLSQLKEGYTLERSGSDHFHILDPEGKPVRAKGNSRPISVPGTPKSSGPHYMKRLTANLTDAGVLSNGTGPKRETTPDQELRDTNRQSHMAVAEQQEQVKEFLKVSEPWIKRLGGWDHRGVVTDLGRIVSHLTNGDRDLQAAAAAISKVKAGEAPGGTNMAALWKLHETMMAQEDPREYYYDMVRELRGLTPVKLEGGAEWPFEVDLIPVEKLFADETYQRPIHDNFARDMVLKFDEQLVGTIDVSERKDGRYAIMDGLQRTTAMTEVGKTAAWAAVYSGLTVAEEAAFFYHKNRDRKMIHPYYHFRARLVSGDPAAKEVNDIVEGFGFQLYNSSGIDHQIAAIKAVEKVFEFSSPWREECLTPSLDLIKRLWFGRKSATDGDLIRGLGRFFQVYADWEIQTKHLEEILAELGPQLVIGRAKDSIQSITGGRGGSSGGFGIGRTIAEIHNTGLTRDKKIDMRRLSPAPGVRTQAMALAELEAGER